MQYCPCGSQKNYIECCGVFIEGKKKPLTPEALMRSRYVAYTQANMTYIAKTMKSPASDHFDAKLSGKWAKKVEWLGLEVKASSFQNTKGFVEFIAHFKENKKSAFIHERSEFHCENGIWYYVDGVHLA